MKNTNEAIISEVVRVNMPTEYGVFTLVAFDDKVYQKTLFALTVGEWTAEESVLVRVHSSCITGDIIGSYRCDCGPQLEAAMRKVQSEGKGVIIYIEQEGRGIGFLNKMKAYKLQEEGYDTVDANLHLGFEADQRNYETAVAALQHLGVQNILLMSNNPTKKNSLADLGLNVVDTVALEIEANEYNAYYLKTKKNRMGHTLFQTKLT